MTGIMCRPRNSARFFLPCCCQLFCLAWTSRMPTVIWVGRSSVMGTVFKTGSRTVTMFNLLVGRVGKGAWYSLVGYQKTFRAPTAAPMVGTAREGGRNRSHRATRLLRTLPFLPLFASPYRGRRDGRSGGALELERLHHKSEFGDVLGGKLIELEVLQQMHAVDDQRDLVQRQRDQLVRIGIDLDRGGIGAKQHRVLGDQEFGRLDAQARVAFSVARRVRVPELAPAGVNNDGVARLERQVLLFDGAFEVLYRDLVSVAQHGDALVAG